MTDATDKKFLAEYNAMEQDRNAQRHRADDAEAECDRLQEVVAGLRKSVEVRIDENKQMVERLRTLAKRNDLTCVKYIASDGYPSIRVRGNDELEEMILEALNVPLISTAQPTNREALEEYADALEENPHAEIWTKEDFVHDIRDWAKEHG